MDSLLHDWHSFSAHVGSLNSVCLSNKWADYRKEHSFLVPFTLDFLQITLVY